MTKDFIQKQKESLIAQKEKLENQLRSFAVESNKAKGEWDAKMPVFDTGGSLEEQADEVEEFSTRLSLEKTLETELKKIIAALEWIKKSKYGICVKCERPISQGRLKVYPQADTCTKCR